MRSINRITAEDIRVRVGVEIGERLEFRDPGAKHLIADLFWPAKAAGETSFVASLNQLRHSGDMAEIQAPPPLPKSQPSFGRRHSTIIKLLGVGALVLVLLIPLLMITGVLSDRLSRRNEAVADITSSWGREQNVIGPLLGIPFQYKFKAVKEVPAPDGKMERREVEETAIATAYFLPESLKIDGDVQTQTLHRGIYDAAVFRAQVTLSGKFAQPVWSTQDRSEGGAMEGRVRDDCGERSARNTRRLGARLGRNEAANAAGIASAGLHNRRDRIARQRSADCA